MIATKEQYVRELNAVHAQIVDLLERTEEPADQAALWQAAEHLSALGSLASLIWSLGAQFAAFEPTLVFDDLEPLAEGDV